MIDPPNYIKNWTCLGSRGAAFEVKSWKLAVQTSWVFSQFITMKCI